jgi:predicted SAM-dependent methyltransferase
MWNSVTTRLAYATADTIERLPGGRNLVTAVRRRTHSRRFRTEYAIACARGDVRLQIACGPYRLDGWLNTDISLDAPLLFDATQRFPVQDNSIHYIFCEHFIEHIPRDKAALFLQESFRALQPDGILRITTPDIETHAREYLARSERARLLLERLRQCGDQYANYYADILNKAFYEDGHVYLYDAEVLEQMLQSAGFKEITLCRIGESSHSVLRGVEQHYKLGPVADEFCLVIEAKKPQPCEDTVNPRQEIALRGVS